MTEYANLLTPLEALVATDPAALTIPDSWVAVCPYLFGALQDLPVEALVNEWIPGPKGHRRTRQSFRVTFLSPPADGLLPRLAKLLEDHEHRVHETDVSLLALHPERAVTCEREGDLVVVDMYRKEEISAEAVVAAVGLVASAQPVMGLFPFLRVRELICTRRVGGPLLLRLRAYRKVECIGEDDAWLAANGFASHEAEATLLAHDSEHPLWLFWQGENVAVFAGAPPEGYTP